jgi:branched-chain amino acid transport system substrate-binding protein
MFSRNRYSIYFVVVLAILLLVPIAACTKEKEPASSAPPLVIGVPCAMGTIAKDMANAATLAAAEINAKEGGVLVDGVKRPIKIVTADTRDLEAGIPIQDVVLAYKDLIAKEKPMALVGGPIRTEAQMAVIENIAADKIIHVFGGGVNSRFARNVRANTAKHKYLFKNSPTEVDLVAGLVKAMDYLKEKNGYNSVFFLVEDVDFAKLAEKVISALLDGRGWEIKGNVHTPLGMTDYSAALLKFKESGAQVGFYIYSSEAAPLAKQYKAMQIPAMMVGVCDPLGGPGAWEATQGAVKGMVNYICGAGNITVAKMPKTVEFQNSFKKKFKELPQLTLGCAQSYDAVYLIVDAINRSGGSIDPDKIAETLLTTSYAGVLGQYKFPPDLHQAPYGEDPATSLIGVVFQWQDGKRVPVFPESIADGIIVTPK